MGTSSHKSIAFVLAIASRRDHSTCIPKGSRNKTARLFDQSVFAHHIAWTVLATTGVIFTASYMLWMIQRLFYGDLNENTADVPVPDVTAREHLALWPLIVVMLLMGVASPYWLRAIDTAGTYLAQEPAPTELLPSADVEPHPGPDVIHDDEKMYMQPAAEATK